MIKEGLKSIAIGLIIITIILSILVGLVYIFLNFGVGPADAVGIIVVTIIGLAASWMIGEAYRDAFSRDQA